MSTSAKMMFGDLPPSSRPTRLIVAAAARMISRPVAVSPVKLILATSGCAASAAPIEAPGPGTTLSTPGGRPASSPSSPRRSAVSGVRLAGLSTTVLPQASAGASFHVAMTIGKFHGTIRPTTPSGSCSVMSSPPFFTAIVSPKNLSAAPA